MSDDEMPLFSFGNDEPDADAKVTDEQVVTLRKAFSAAQMNDPQECADLVRSCVIRPVSSLYDLLPQDVRPILRRIKERSETRSAGVGSAWDTRDHDTWIDKL